MTGPPETGAAAPAGGTRPGSRPDAGAAPPATRRQDVVDVYHGVSVVDPFRWLESPSAERDDWFAAQHAYARGVLAALPGRTGLRDELRRANLDSERIDVLRVVGPRPRIFAFHRRPGAETSELVVRDGWSAPERVLVDPAARSAGGAHVTIDVAYPSPDGRRVAYVVSKAGSEDGTIEIIEVDSGRVLPDRIDRTQVPVISWRPDGRSFFYWRRARPRPGATAADWYRSSATYLHVIGTDPDGAPPVIGAGMPELGLGPDDYTGVTATPRSRWALAAATPGIGDWAFLVAPLAGVVPGKTRWRKVVGTDDKVARALIHGDRVYALTHAGAPNYRIVSFDAASGTIAKAEDFVPASGQVLVDLAAARDAMYVVTLDRGIHRLFRVSWRTKARQEIRLPFEGSIQQLVSDPARVGLVFAVEGWTERPRWLELEPPAALRELPLTSSLGRVEDLVAERAAATSRDGVAVPVTIIRRRGGGAGERTPALLTGYGAYGLSASPAYSPFLLTWVRRGGVYAICHVRGGGELGKSWHLDGIKQKKENGVDDFIACAEHLFAGKYTAPRRLTAFGGSAGALVVGGAITKRPDLFKAAVIQVGQLNPLRLEVTEGGAWHTRETGDVKVEPEFRSLLASDPYHRIRDETLYPAVLLTAGLHDLRVPAWMPAKFAARLQSTRRPSPTLLRLDHDNGHGFSSTQTQREEEYADIYAFALWQSGMETK